jgi:peptidoglycan/xylan/chitin deacetylase (PgdA/CDA1 family)/GT2 family glycosyltransferase
MDDSIRVSVIIPAHNAAATIAETLDSLCAQTFVAWEAIVVDDGSTDATWEIAARYAARDARIRVLRQSHSGVSAARNAGVQAAHTDWLLFLDADDWILPAHLQRMSDMLATDPTLDAVHCGWARVASDGAVFDAQFCPHAEDLFPLFVRRCPFAIHACVVRRALVEAVGGFDPSLRIGEDWDLWRRLALAGARFGTVREVLAHYRMRPGSASHNSELFLVDSLRVLERGFAADPRVPNPLPAYAQGMPTEQLPSIALYLACWTAGLALGAGADARRLLDRVEVDGQIGIDPAVVARIIFETAPLATGHSPDAWPEIWSGLAERLDAFLSELEARSQEPRLARRCCLALERLILERSRPQRSLSLRYTRSTCVEISKPLSDIILPATVERLHCLIELEGRPLGVLELPVCDGCVSAPVLADAIAAQFAWPILKRFFARTVYRDLRVEWGPTGLSIWRGSLCLADGLPDDKRALWRQAHDLIGWTVFLQEFWGRPTWASAQFYDPQTVEPGLPRRRIDGAWLMIEAADDLQDLEVCVPALDITLTVGGVAAAALTIPIDRPVISAQELRAALTLALGKELCRVAVREGLIGRPLMAGGSLRERLAEAAIALPRPNTIAPDSPIQLVLTSTDLTLGVMGASALVPGAAGALRRVATPGERVMVLGRHMHDSIGTSVARRASLPAAAAGELIDAAQAAGEAVIHLPWPNGRPRRVCYAPDIIWRAARSTHRAWANPANLWPPRSARRPDDPATPQTKSEVATTDRLPILMYHRIAPTGAPALARYRVTPEAFEAQLRYLHDAGYYSISLEEWRTAMELKRPLPGRAVVLTFDDGYLDFLTNAWPLLQQYGFSAIVFLVADAIGQSNRWDGSYGEEVLLLGWREIRRLRDEGVEFGSHSASHAPLTGLTPAEVVREGARARAILSRGLGSPVTTFAYPYGDQDQVVQHLIGACGYVFGLSCVSARSGLDDSLLELPRIEVAGTDSLETFIAKLSW